MLGERLIKQKDPLVERKSKKASVKQNESDGRPRRSERADFRK